MPDPRLDPQLFSINKLETCVTVDGQRQYETKASYDKHTRRHVNTLDLPPDKDFSINFRIGGNKPITKNDDNGLALETSLDGQAIHPVFIKYRNHETVELSHIFGNGENGEETKFSLYIAAITPSGDPLTPELSEEVGTLKIDVFPANLKKSTGASKYKSKSSLRCITSAFDADVKSKPYCIRTGPAEIATSQDRGANWMPSVPYKTKESDRLITIVYQYRRRVDAALPENRNGGINLAGGVLQPEDLKTFIKDTIIEVVEERIQSRNGNVNGAKRGRDNGTDRGMTDFTHFGNESNEGSVSREASPLSGIDEDEARSRRRMKTEMSDHGEGDLYW
ncbi:uncharacterized protein MKK02DRAFT_43518 [Dioszegia hungarica]|uniref:Uncharacterized protein n=1 Tax=Dioszegia hungarica TaxID=4972 RepID=A0AA38HAE2_9TREE|nr:uncharacterized protein MKK02DRAFT_43518 [Dioszegia hungarica]KAI9637592.1 hypothetical protein MKK02DRAFT_43518 [Dioszegia hungarica]